jgi:hypothetical protein
VCATVGTTNVIRCCSRFAESERTLRALRAASTEERHAAAQLLARVFSGEDKLEVDALCNPLLTEDEKEAIASIPSRNNLGSTSDSVSDLGDRITTGICFDSQSHSIPSIPGEGKARNDMKNGQVRALSVPSSR